MRIVLGLFILAFHFSAHGAELFGFGETPRSFGMGGVRTLRGDGDDASTVLWNPAGLAYIKGVKWTMFNGNMALTTAEGARDLLSGGGGGGGSGLAALDPYYGIPIHIGGMGYTAMAVPSFGFAIFNNGYGKFHLHNPAFPELETTYFNDSGYNLSGALDFGAFALGVTVKKINRKGGPKTIGADVLTGGIDTSTMLNYFTDQGTGYGFDLGFMYKAPGPLEPTVHIAWQNVGKINFIQTGGSAAPPMLDDDLTAGIFFGKNTTVAGFSAGLEYRHIGNANEQLGKKIHMGTEINLPIVDVRAGFYQGYTTYGLGMDLLFFQFDAALYTVETGAYPGQTPDQRFHIGLSTTMSFDPNFTITELGKNGKRRNLKQRR